jgi:hypothetical protein
MTNMIGSWPLLPLSRLDPYNAARRALDRDQVVAVWVLVSLTLDPELDGRAVHLSQQDRAAIALALSGAWRYARIPCPQVIVWQVSGGRERVVLLTRLTFTRPPAAA